MRSSVSKIVDLLLEDQIDRFKPVDYSGFSPRGSSYFGNRKEIFVYFDPEVRKFKININGGIYGLFDTLQLRTILTYMEAIDLETGVSADAPGFIDKVYKANGDPIYIKAKPAVLGSKTGILAGYRLN